jgi:hypothetical protein
MTSPTSLEEITRALNMDELPAEEQEKILLDLNALIFRGSIMRMLEQMDQQTRDEFNALAESDASEEQLKAFLDEKVPNADQAVADTIAALTSDILTVTSNQ